MFRKWLIILLREYKKRQARRQLAWQQLLSRKGIGLKTRILELREQACPFSDYVQCSLHTRLRVNGKTVDRWVETILARERTLQIGDVVHIRYYPAHFRKVLVL